MSRHGQRNWVVGEGHAALLGLICVLAVAAVVPGPAGAAAPAPIRLASVLDLAGKSRLLGANMRAGLEAALFGATVHGHPVEIDFYNDNYSPNLTREAASSALAGGATAMVGNVGTPTARAILPMLESADVPAVAFYTGADLLRARERRGVFNLRASYDQEIATLVNEAVANGIDTSRMCAVAQNDAFGDAGLRGFARALGRIEGSGATVRSVRAAISVSGHSARRNGIGPVGFFEREKPAMYHAYRSLKRWESRTETRCALALVIGTYKAVGRFQAFVRFKDEDWLIAALSFTGAEALGPLIHSGPPDDRVIMMQVVPPLDADLAIVREARATLGRQLGYISLEGFIAGRLMLAALELAPANPTRAQVQQALKSGDFSLDGLRFDFSADNQALDAVHLTYLDASGWRPLDSEQWRRWQPRHPLHRLTEWLP